MKLEGSVKVGNPEWSNRALSDLSSTGTNLQRLGDLRKGREKLKKVTGIIMLPEKKGLRSKQNVNSTLGMMVRA